MSNFSNRLPATAFLSLEDFVATIHALSQPCLIPRPQLIVSPEMKARIDADPALQKLVAAVTGSCFDPP